MSTSGLPTPIVPLTARRRRSSELASHRWLRRLSLPNLPVVFEHRTLRYLEFYRNTRRGRSIIEAWARKSGRYTPAIVRALGDAGLPTDLVWMSLIESGHNPTIVSPAGAAGLWQFIPESARLYGLTVDRWVDERLDPMRSTRAAIRFLTDLKQRFGTWELAMAAYNMGHYGLSRVIRRYNTNDYWKLSRLEAALPLETALYVPKVTAVAIAMKNRREFGIGGVASERELGFDTIRVAPGIELSKLASLMGLSSESLSELNPHYLLGRTPPSATADRTWEVRVPPGQRRSGQLAASSLSGDRHATVEVRQGDTVESIAARLRGNEGDLRRLNAIGPSERLAAGARLFVPESLAAKPSGDRPRFRPDSENVVVLPTARFSYPNRHRVFYRTLPDDDLATVARSLGVGHSELVLWNDLDPRAVLQADMVLQAFVPKHRALGSVRVVREESTGKLLTAGSAGFLDHFEAQRGRKRLQILARAGDTLKSIGLRYGLSGGMMERINHLPRHQRLSEGRPVVVYARYGPIPSESLWSRAPDPLPPVDPPHPKELPTAPGW